MCDNIRGYKYEQSYTPSFNLSKCNTVFQCISKICLLFANQWSRKGSFLWDWVLISFLQNLIIFFILFLLHLPHIALNSSYPSNCLFIHIKMALYHGGRQFFLFHLPTVESWASYLNSSRLGFFMCQAQNAVVSIFWNNYCKIWYIVVI